MSAGFEPRIVSSVVRRMREILIPYQQKMRGVVVSVSADEQTAIVRRPKEPASIARKPFVNTVAGLAAGDQVMCMVDRGGGIVVGVVGGKAPPEPTIVDTAIVSLPNGTGTFDVANETIGPASEIRTVDLVALHAEIPDAARGLQVILYSGPQDSKSIFIDRADATPNANSPRIVAQVGNIVTSQLHIGLAKSGTNANRLRIRNSHGSLSATGIYMWITGYWL